MSQRARPTALKLIVLACLVPAGCNDRSGPAPRAEIAVTNSYLESVVRDLCGQDVEVLCLAPPGMCPGHFDLSPAQVQALQNCRMLLLFDFQKQVEQTLIRLRRNGLATHLIHTPPGLCVPETYLAACRGVAEVLSEADPEQAEVFQQRVAAVAARLRTLGGELRDAVRQSPVASAEILASNRQTAFARWLGLEPVGTFIGSDMETVANIDHCLRKAAGRQVRFVIANRQEGTALAEALAERLRAKAVVFSNFPPAGPDGGFDRLLRRNVSALLEAVSK